MNCPICKQPVAARANVRCRRCQKAARDIYDDYGNLIHSPREDGVYGDPPSHDYEPEDDTW